MSRHPHIPGDARTKECARQWAEEVWAFAPRTCACVVWFEPANPKGRTTKPSVKKAEAQYHAAAARGDLAEARHAIMSVVPLGGVAWCESREELADVLTERLRYGQGCSDFGAIADRFVWLVCWRE